VGFKLCNLDTVGHLFSRATNFVNRLKRHFMEIVFTKQHLRCTLTYYTTCMCYKPEINHDWGTRGKVLHRFHSTRVSCVQRYMESRNWQGAYLRKRIWEPSWSLCCISCSWRQRYGWACPSNNIGFVLLFSEKKWNDFMPGNWKTTALTSWNHLVWHRLNPLLPCSLRKWQLMACDPIKGHSG